MISRTLQRLFSIHIIQQFRMTALLKKGSPKRKEARELVSSLEIHFVEDLIHEIGHVRINSSEFG